MRWFSLVLLMAVAGCDTPEDLYGNDTDNPCAHDIGRAHILIAQGPESDFSIGPPYIHTAHLGVGDTVQYRAQVRRVTSSGSSSLGCGYGPYGYGDTVQAAISWSTSHPAIAAVNQTGRLIAHTAGTTSLDFSASSLGIDGGFTVFVE